LRTLLPPAFVREQSSAAGLSAAAGRLLWLLSSDVVDDRADARVHADSAARRGGR
jgi:hypothetical protein